ncbi:hypothetical protein [Cyanobacterium sp. uoEpiScrs1]|nr:hypothetical protein [Cyanobacterium sp. uoEpiScrs1]
MFEIILQSEVYDEREIPSSYNKDNFCDQNSPVGSQKLSLV